MTTDLWMLVCSAVLCLSLPIVYLIGRTMTPGGLKWGMGNRDTKLEVPAWTARAERTHANHLETLAPFAVLVLAAHVSGQANDLTALGAMLYFAGRAAHAAVYIAGLTGIRTAVFMVSMAGNVLIFSQLF